MSQRNPMNERYQDENRTGKTRKSAASAKPTTARAATVREPAPKTKKQKKAEAREREKKREQRYTVDVPDNQRLESLPEYKRLRRIWWILLAAAIVLIGFSIYTTYNESLAMLYLPSIIVGYLLVIAAFYIEFRPIRKLRNQHREIIMQGKSKEARAQQKKARAEARALQKEAAEKAANEPAEQPKEGLGARLMKRLPLGGSSSAEQKADASESDDAAGKDGETGK